MMTSVEMSYALEAMLLAAPVPRKKRELSQSLRRFVAESEGTQADSTASETDTKGAQATQLPAGAARAEAPGHLPDAEDAAAAQGERGPRADGAADATAADLVAALAREATDTLKPSAGPPPAGAETAAGESTAPHTPATAKGLATGEAPAGVAPGAATAGTAGTAGTAAATHGSEGAEPAEKRANSDGAPAAGAPEPEAHFALSEPPTPSEAPFSARFAEAFRLLEQRWLSRLLGGIVLTEVADGWAFRTNARFGPLLQQQQQQRPIKLSKPAFEALAIVAYRQPVTKPEVDELRGVDSGNGLRVLLERDLIEVVGKKEEPGRPLLYATTKTFLNVFSLPKLADLPSLEQAEELGDEPVDLTELAQQAPELMAEDEAATSRLDVAIEALEGVHLAARKAFAEHGIALGEEEEAAKEGFAGDSLSGHADAAGHRPAAAGHKASGAARAGNKTPANRRQGRSKGDAAHAQGARAPGPPAAKKGDLPTLH